MGTDDTNNVSTCQHIILQRFNMGTATVLDSVVLMSGKPTWTVPKFGARLRALRGKLSLRRVAQMLHAKGLPETFGASTLKRYEDGRAPDVVVLWAISELYGQPAGELLDAVAQEALGKRTAHPAKPGRPTPMLDDDEHWWLDAWRELRAADRAMLRQAVDNALTLKRLREQNPPSTRNSKKRVG
jgi:transcriptional regulator with XRE-family HTH domain